MYTGMILLQVLKLLLVAVLHVLLHIGELLLLMNPQVVLHLREQLLVVDLLLQLMLCCYG